MQICLFQEDNYSVAIYPPTDVMEEIAAMKIQLVQRIGWFNSINSMDPKTIANESRSLSFWGE